MTYLDEIFRPITQSLLGSIGKAITYTRVTPGAYDPATGTGTADTVATTTVHGIIEEYRGQALMGGVEIGDKKVSVPGADFTTPPTSGDRVTIDAVPFAVMSVGAIYSGELIAMYVLQCRRA